MLRLLARGATESSASVNAPVGGRAALGSGSLAEAPGSRVLRRSGRTARRSSGTRPWRFGSHRASPAPGSDLVILLVRVVLLLRRDPEASHPARIPEVLWLFDPQLDKVIPRTSQSSTAGSSKVPSEACSCPNRVPGQWTFSPR